MTDNRIYLYDSTLRDGCQARGVDLNTADKQAIALELDRFGIDYIEGGWPGANPADDAFFSELPPLKRAIVTAFGMTRKAGRSASNDTGLTTLLQTGVKTVCLVGKASKFQVEVALQIDLQENLKMISESIEFFVKKGIEVIFDAEHFFDGYKADSKYSLEVAKAAHDAGARWVVLCDTNGGTLPDEVEKIVSETVKAVSGDRLGIHCHNDTENAVANSLAAVRAGVRHIQGTINGVGERCGNANLISIIPTLMLKMGYETGVSKANLKNITHLSRLLDDRLNRSPNQHQPYVGAAAFAHKGGIHVSAIARDKTAYEHIDPELVGNETEILLSDKAGKASIIARLDALGIDVDSDDERVSKLLSELKARESMGYAYESAEASFELLVRKTFDKIPNFFELLNFRVMDERRYNARGKIITVSEATIKAEINGEVIMTVAEGNGPVNALDEALRKALATAYPSLKGMTLVDYKVRILTPSEGTKALTRVLIESTDELGNRWSTVGVSGNVIAASYNALHDSITYKLIKSVK